MRILLVVCFLASLQSIQGVDWQGNWAYNCDFNGADLDNERIPSAQCGGKCAETSGCTHWVHSTWDGTDYCWMKTGGATKSQAFDTSNGKTNTCGVNGANTNDDKCSQLTKGKFTYGRDWQNENTDYNAYDYVTIWVGTIAQGCSGKQSCTDFNNYYQGTYARKLKALGKTPVVYGYIIAYEARNNNDIQDCNVDPLNNLCHKGSEWIRNNKDHIISRYSHQAENFARILGKDGFMVWLLEPDFWQFYGDHDTQESGTLSGEEMRSLFDGIVKNIKKHLPNAAISWDISAWIPDKQTWWNYFKTADIDFIHTSGGEAHGETSQIKPDEATWAEMSRLTGKKIIADCGYAVAGEPNRNRAPWYQQHNVNSRIKDGVVAVTLSGSEQNPNFHPNNLC